MRAGGWLWIAALAGCPAHEGPIDVVLIDLDGEVDVRWAEQGSNDFVPCENGTTDPEAWVGCGPYGAGKPGDYVVRVVWEGQTAERDVRLERDGDYRANVVIVFTPEDFEG